MILYTNVNQLNDSSPSLRGGGFSHPVVSSEVSSGILGKKVPWRWRAMEEVLLLLFPFSEHLPLSHFMEVSFLSLLCLLVPHSGTLLACSSEAVPGPLGYPLSWGQVCLWHMVLCWTDILELLVYLGSVLTVETCWFYTKWLLDRLISLGLIMACKQWVCSGQSRWLSISTLRAEVVGTRVDWDHSWL